MALAGHRDEHDEMTSLDSVGLLNHRRELRSFCGIHEGARSEAAYYGK